ncbi:MAG: hypothetical protein LWW86_13030 [Micrococcales bacterium]|nr:hypothetical protein [Micrococcales bacterium]
MSRPDDEWADDARAQQAQEFFAGLRCGPVSTDRDLLDAAVRRATSVRRRRTVGGAVGGLGAVGLIAAAVAIGPGVLDTAPVPPATGPSTSVSASSLTTSSTPPTATTSASMSGTGTPSIARSSSTTTLSSTTPPTEATSGTSAPTSEPTSAATTGQPTAVDPTGASSAPPAGAAPQSTSPSSEPPSSPPPTSPANDIAPIPASVFPVAAQLPWQLAPYSTIEVPRSPIVAGAQSCNLGRESASRPQPTSATQYQAVSPDSAPDGVRRAAELQLTVTRFASEEAAITAMQQTLDNSGECLWSQPPSAWLPSATGTGNSTWSYLNRSGELPEVAVLERSGRVIVGGYIYTVYDNPADEATAAVQRTLANVVGAGLAKGQA